MLRRLPTWLALCALSLVLLAGGGALWLSRLGPAHAPRVVVHLPAAQALHDWDEVLARPGPISVLTLDTGLVRAPKPMLLDGESPLHSQFRDDGSDLHVYAHLVRHASAGDVLIDSGLDDSYATAALGTMRGPGRLMYALNGVRFEQEPGRDVHAQLRTHQAILRAIYFTHLHGDHAAALPSFPVSLPVYVGRGEPDDLGHHLDFGLVGHERPLRELDFAQAAAVPPFERVLDVFGDGSLLAIATPGHTSGHVSYLVNGEAEAVLLTGDACHMVWAFEHGVAPSSSTARGQAQARDSLARIRAFAARYPQVRIVLGHQERATPEAELTMNRQPRR
jgi:N-acyl homoserine lactone hydrolase